jgi:small-conductance mechanosensitive channel
LPPYHELVTLLSGVEVHGAWAARRLDEDRVARLRNLALDKEGQLRRRLTALVATAVAFGAAGSLQAGFLCAMVMLRMRIAWLRRFVMLALPLAAATAAATASCDELAVRGVFYCVAALCLGYFGAAWVAFAKAMVRGGWRQPSLRILALVPALTACFLWATWAWPGAAPILREYGLNNLTGPLALIVALFLLRSIFKRATGGGSDSMPRW